jgi:hypothetical protein
MKRVSQLTAAALAFSLLSACANSGLPNPNFGEMIRNIFPSFERMTEQERREANRSKAWDKLTFRTSVQAVGNNRLEIEARGSLGKGIQKVEDTFLTRAAAETIREGYDGFIISYLDYESQFPVSMTNGFTSFPETVEISTYEEFLSYSKEQRIMMSAGAMNFKKIRGVIVMLKEEDNRLGAYFDADELFENFIVTYRLR